MWFFLQKQGRIKLAISFLRPGTQNVLDGMEDKRLWAEDFENAEGGFVNA